MCSASWMFSMLTRRMKSGCASWWSKVSSASRRMAATGSRCSTSSSCSACRITRVRALQNGREQLFLAAEVVVDHPLRGAGAGGDLVDPGARRNRPGRTPGWPRRGSRPWCGRRRGCARRVVPVLRRWSSGSFGRGASARDCRSRRPAAGASSSPLPRLARLPDMTNEPVRTLASRSRRPAVPQDSYLVGLIGSGIGPSLSPALHEREADRQGLRYLYRLIDIDRARRRPGGGGRPRARRPRPRLRRPEHHPPLQAARHRAPRRARPAGRGARRGQHRRLRGRARDRPQHGRHRVRGAPSPAGCPTPRWSGSCSWARAARARPSRTPCSPWAPGTSPSSTRCPTGPRTSPPR